MIEYIVEVQTVADWNNMMCGGWPNVIREIVEAENVADAIAKTKEKYGNGYVVNNRRVETKKEADERIERNRKWVEEYNAKKNKKRG